MKKLMFLVCFTLIIASISDAEKYGKQQKIKYSANLFQGEWEEIVPDNYQYTKEAKHFEISGKHMQWNGADKGYIGIRESEKDGRKFLIKFNFLDSNGTRYYRPFIINQNLIRFNRSTFKRRGTVQNRIERIDNIIGSWKYEGEIFEGKILISDESITLALKNKKPTEEINLSMNVLGTTIMDGAYFSDVKFRHGNRNKRAILTSVQIDKNTMWIFLDDNDPLVLKKEKDGIEIRWKKIVQIHSSMDNKIKYGSFAYYTQEKNITNINTQFLPKRGLINKSEKGIISTGSYDSIIEAPPKHRKIEIEMGWDGKSLSMYYIAMPPKIEPRIPISAQMLSEYIPGTHVYLIVPKDSFPVLENQFVAVYGENEKLDVAKLISPEKVEPSKVLKIYNLILDGGIPKQKKTDISELERAFDGTLNLMGVYGEIGGFFKNVFKQKSEKEEARRVQELKVKYGKGYRVYKIPFNVMERLTLKGVHIGRLNEISFYSEDPKDSKIYLEIPHLTFEQSIQGATRMATLEGLSYELEVKPEFIAAANNVFDNKKVKEKKHRKVYKEPPRRPSISIYDAVEWGNDEQVHSHYYYKTASLDGEKDNVPLIFVAADMGHTHIVEQLISYGVSPNSICKRKKITVENLQKYNIPYRLYRSDLSILNFSIYKGNFEIVKLLLDHGANTDLSMKIALDRGNSELVKLLLAAGARAEDDPALLFKAVESTNYELVKLLIDCGIDINKLNRTGKSVLSLAAGIGDLRIVALLIDSGSEINLGKNKKDLPLYRAMRSSQLKMVKYLLSNGADAKLISLVGVKDIEIAKILIEAGADVNANSPLSTAPIEIAMLLIEAGADVNANSSLSTASKAGDIERVKLLIEAGADVNAKNKHNRTPLFEAVKIYGDKSEKWSACAKIAKILIEAGADVNARDAHQATPLHVAKFGLAAQVLIDAGADVNAKDDRGNTPLSLIRPYVGNDYYGRGYSQVFKLLREHGGK